MGRYLFIFNDSNSLDRDLKGGLIPSFFNNTLLNYSNQIHGCVAMVIKCLNYTSLYCTTVHVCVSMSCFWISSLRDALPE